MEFSAQEIKTTLNHSSDLAHPTLRIIDANLNRLREGIRVLEDICRYEYNHSHFAYTLKELRHRCKLDLIQTLLESRDSLNDVLRESTPNEMERADLKSIVIANFKRTQESSRVLEEILKLHNPQDSNNFKAIRYQLYTLEKEIFALFINQN